MRITLAALAAVVCVGCGGGAMDVDAGDDARAPADGAATPDAGVDSATSLHDGGVGPDATQTDGGAPPQVIGLRVLPAMALLEPGGSQTLVALAVYDDGSARDVTSSATWSSMASTRVSVSSAGVVTALMAGAPVGIMASYGGFDASATISVPAATLVGVTLSAPSLDPLPIGATRTYSAIGILSDGSSRILDTDPALTWTSSDPSVATIATGTVTPVAPGITNIGASYDTGATALVATALPLRITDVALVSIVVVGVGGGDTVVGFDRAFRATATFSDSSSRDVTSDPFTIWSVASTAVATLVPGRPGRVTGIGRGTTSVRASIGGPTNAVFGEAPIRVSDVRLSQLIMTPRHMNIVIGTAGATPRILGRFEDGSVADVTGSSTIAFASSDPARVTIVNGTVSAAAGATPAPAISIFAAVGSISTTSYADVTRAPSVTSVTVALPPNVVPVGMSRRATATASSFDGLVTTLRDVTDEVVWATAAPLLATVSNAPGSRGLVMGVAATASPTSVTATFTNADGSSVVGSTSLRVTDCPFASIDVQSPDDAASATSVTLRRGAARAPQVLGHFSATGSACSGLGGFAYDVTALATYTTSDPAQLAIEGASMRVPATALEGQMAVLTAHLGPLSDTLSVTAGPACLSSVAVMPSMQVGPWTATGAVPLTFSASGTTLDAVLVPNLPGTWSSAAAIDATGRATATTPGAYAVTFQAATGLACDSTTVGSAMASWAEEEPSALRVVATPAIVAVSGTTHLSAIATFPTYGDIDVSALVRWSGCVPGADGSYTPTVAGTCTARAAFDGRVATGTISAGTASLIVEGALLGSCDLTPLSGQDPALHWTSAARGVPGISSRFRARMAIAGSTELIDVTERVTWSVDLGTVANGVVSPPATAALVHVTAMATLPELVGTASATLDTNGAGTITSLVVVGPTPAPIQLRSGAAQWLGVLLTTDTSRVVCAQGTTGIAWSSSDPTVLGFDTDGRVRTFTTGMATLRATVGARFDERLAYSLSPRSTGFAIAPNDIIAFFGDRLRVFPEVSFSDGSTVDAPVVTWRVTPFGVATVSPTSIVSVAPVGSGRGIIDGVVVLEGVMVDSGALGTGARLVALP